MNIVVTIPKDRQLEVEREEREVAERLEDGEKDLFYYWEMGRLPKRAPDRVYFVWNGAVRAYHEVVGQHDGHIYMRPEIHPITPIPMKGFRGYRYFDPEEHRGRKTA